MSERPILFNAEMSRAIRDGIKTHTRRVIRLPHGCSGRQVGESGNPENPLGFMYPGGIKRPPCNKGDILWVRETWHKDAGRYMYKANYSKDDKFYRNGKEVGIRWKPSIHMPKEAARTFLLVEAVWCERLWEMDSQDCLAEGIVPAYKGTTISVVDRFATLWDSTIKPTDRNVYGWAANPWVWVIKFRQCVKPEGWADHG